jgi:arginase
MNKKVKIFGVPLDLGANKLGVDMGPTAMRYAGLRYALAYNKMDFSDYGDLIIDQSFNPNSSIEENYRSVISDISENLSELTHTSLIEGYIPVVLGGDHSTSIGSIAGASKKANRLGLLWLDRHPDSNTPQTSPSGNIHGMTVAISLGYGYPELVNCGRFSPKIAPENICMIGVNDIDQEESRFLNELGVKVFTLMDVERIGIVKAAEEALKIVTNQCDLVHVSFDIDVLDPLIAPGTGILSRGGLSYREISYIMKYLGQQKVVGSIDIIEINPLLDIKNTTAELAVEMLIAALGGSFGDYERNYLKIHTQRK